MANGPKSTRVTITKTPVAAKRQTKRAPNGARQKIASRRSDSITNQYLDAIINPETATPVGIPDDCVAKTTTWRTRHRITVQTGPGGCCLYGFKPTLSNGVIRYGLTNDVTGAGPHHLAASNPSPNLSLATIGGVVSGRDAAMIRSHYDCLRPVGFTLAWTDIESAVNAKGTVTFAMFAAEDDPAVFTPQGLPGSGTGIESLNGFLPNVHPLSSIDDLDDIAGAVTARVQEELVGVWVPQAPESLEWRTPPNVGAVAGDRPSWGNTGVNFDNIMDPSMNLYYMFAVSQYPDSSSGVVIGPNTTLPAQLSTGLDPHWQLLPTLVFGARGCNPNADIGELIATIIWEGIPNDTNGSAIPTAISPYVPNELAQAHNIVPMLPAARNLTVASAPQNRIFEAANQASGDLYRPGVQQRAAVSGQSFLSRIGGFLKGAASTLSPALMKLPGIGPLLGSAAAFIGSL